VVIWASSLVPEAVLQHAPATATVHDSAAMTLEDVIEVYDAHPDNTIVRLHSGDPSVYGAIQEQIDWCLANGRDFEIVPGVSSLAAAAAAVGRELTIPGVSQSVVLTRLAGRTKASMPDRESVRAFAAHQSTMAVFLSAARPEELQDELLAGYPPETPATIVIRATWPDERVVRTRVADLRHDLAATKARTTVLVLVGDALADDRGPAARSHLYSPTYSHKFRRAAT
jgi:precorrin-4/cobalt-precorrin-4 C11-methyltransferase